MKPWIVDVPVAINIWIRPELQKKQWDVIKEARPSTLFIQSDGGRDEDEWSAINKNRELIDNGIDWDCAVYRLYEKENNGLYHMIFKLRDLVWSKVDRCIFLEDDHIPSVSYFRFCAELLERYKDDLRIETISGFNNINIWESDGSDYFFSRKGSIWGLATWKNRIFNMNISDYKDNSYLLKCLNNIKNIDAAFYKRVYGYCTDDFYENHVPGPEFWHNFNIWSQHRLNIIVSKNMITCEGATNNAAHSREYDKLPDYLKPLFNSERYEIDFPIKHPKFVVNDEEYAVAVEYSIGERVLFIKRPLKIKIINAIKERRLFKTVLSKIIGKSK